MGSAVISSNKVAGTAVYDLRGDKLGSIDDIVIDKRSGQVRYAALEFGGLFGIGTDRYPLPWSILTYDTDRDGYVVSLDKQQIEQAPRYTQGQSPDYSDDYGRQVFAYYDIGW